MKLIRNAVGISKLIFILLLLVAAIVGGILSYMWTMGYYVSLEMHLPEAPTVTITNVTFDPQDATTFNLTLLNPSLSPFSVNIDQVMVSTEDGVLNTVGTHPVLGELSVGESKTFKCIWSWANHTNENVSVHVFVEGGSGATFQAKTPLVNLTITEAVFNSTISVTSFNLTVQNSASSVTYVNVTSVRVETRTAQNVTPFLPYTLHPNSSVGFSCHLDWTEYQGRNVTVRVDTSQGYATYHTQATPEPVVLAITNAVFDTANKTRFDVTVQNNASSPTHVDVIGVTVTVNETTYETELNVTLPYVLQPNSTVTFECSWDWTNYQGMTATITVHTKQGFEKTYPHQIPVG